MDKLSTTEIQSGLKASRLGRKIILLDTAASTNDAAWGYAGQADCDGLCVLAEQQTAGRGRRGRTWHSQSGQSILFSLLLSPNAGSLSLLSLAAPVAVAETISLTCGLDAAVKWPNDVLIDGRKVAGILIESRKSGGQEFFVVGIGINVHQDKAFFNAQPMDTPATSLDIESGRQIDRNQFIKTMLEQLEYRFSTPSESIVEEWKRRNRQIGERIQLESDGKLYSGTCVGIDPAEGLIIQLDGGGIRMFSAATSTVVKNP